MRVLISGGRGQLATDLARLLPPEDVCTLGHDELDITQTAHLQRVIRDRAPDVFVNTAAFHHVDRCETEPEMSFAVNAAAVQRLAAACKEQGVKLVHISTDYVFGGRRSTPYGEDDPVDPVSVYGASKAAGEMAIRCTLSDHIIVRTTGLYGLAGRTSQRGNFVETMLRLALSGERISIVADQTLTPSYTRDVAETLIMLMRLDATGTYHVTNDGACSWYEFAREVFRVARMTVDVHAVAQGDRRASAARPTYSVLGKGRLASLGIRPRRWTDALAAYVDERNSESAACV